MSPRFLKVSTCVSPNTYKYYFSDSKTASSLWDALVQRYGQPSCNSFFNTREILTEKFCFRTTSWFDPLTVIVRGEPDDEFISLHEYILANE